ncbi:hypothetical protein JX265_009727 [Neoarthrinium moseri]|uniref:Uncharacterized protein n=1 Tax=Neoarthrinium moseri TaxID=1658444 RepID=A0A9P9WFQ7_9PEZI|nr:hypothetical protein JX265_009727 [Neoarthrinium moseri]
MATEEFRTPHRPRYRVTKPQNRGDRSQPWTASRCQRLLRPLLSRIALLRRDLALLSSQRSVTAPAREDNSGKRRTEDCAWLLPRKRLRHTYSQKCTDTSVINSVAAESSRFKAAKDLQRDSSAVNSVSYTPLLRRARGHLSSSPIQEPEHIPQHQPAGRKKVLGSQAHLEDRLSLLRSQLSQARYSDLEAIYRSLEALLTATSRQPRRKGASSLLDMCLRKVPQYISGVEAWEVYEAEKTGTKSSSTASDVSSRVYTELEELGASDSGWQHLRTVVEMDAVSVIRDAMAEGLFPDDFSMLLLDLCACYGIGNPLSDAMQTFLARQYPGPSGSGSDFSEDTKLQPLRFLRELSQDRGRKSLLLQQCSQLLLQGLLPSTWLVTGELQQLCGLAYQMLTREEAALDAVDFLATSTVLLCRHQRSKKGQDVKYEMVLACQRTLLELLSTLSAMRRLAEDALQDSESSPSAVSKANYISRSLGFTFQACLAEIDSWKGRRGKPRDLLRLATFLSSDMAQDSRTDTSVMNAVTSAYESKKNQAAPKGASAPSIYDNMISLVSSIAKTCGRVAGQSSREYLARFAQQLGRVGLQEQILEGILKAGAFSLAQQTKNVRDLIFAEQLVSSTLGADNEQQGKPQQQSLFEGYRWDETISEWVTVSPVVQRSQVAEQAHRPFTGRKATRRRTSVQPLYPEPRTPTKSTPSTSIVADSPTAPESGRYASSETSKRGLRAEPNGKAGRQGGSRCNECEARIPDCLSGRSCGRCNNESAKRGVHDELGHDNDDDNKENREQAVRRKRYSDVPRSAQPGTKRRIRLSGGGAHSDDELGI